MKLSGFVVLAMVVCSLLVAGQSPAPPVARPSEDYSGMYSFLREGEFVQVTVEDDGRVTGFVSRFGDTESDRGAFLDQFFKEAKLDGTKFAFTTDTVHGVWYEFRGTIERGEAKVPSQEAYYVLKGTLTDTRTNADQKVTAKSQQVLFNSFPKDTGSAPSKQD
jgi:hypothetical protein